MANSKAPVNGNNIIHVLHVDDDSSNLEISKIVLSEMGNFAVDFASCVDEALGKLAMKDYDVVVSDYEMPLKTGLDFLLELKRQKNDVPFILFTGKGREEVAIKALNLGAIGYFNKQGSPETVYGELSHGIRQIVERKKAEKALRNSEENIRAYLESSPISIFVANSNGKYEYVNLAALRLLGFSLKEILNMTVFEVVPKEDVSGLRFKQLNEKGYFAGEMKLKRKNDTLVDVFLSSNRLPDGKLIAFCEDITERKKAEYEIKESIANYQSLINGMSESAWVIDFSGNFLEVNDSACDILGYSKNELLSIGITGIDKYLSGEQVGKLIERLLLVKKQVFETVHTAKDGTEVPVEISSSIIQYHRKKAILSIARNIIEHKKIEQESRENESKYRSLFDNMINGFAYCKIEFDTQNKPVDFIYLEVNEAFEKLTGLKRERVIAKNVSEAIPGIREANPELFEIYGRVSLTGNEEKFEIYVGPLNIWLSILAYSPKKGYFAAIFENITERKKTEHALLENEERYRLLYQSAGIGVGYYTVDGKVISYNEIALQNMGGMKLPDVVGKSVYDLFPKENADVYFERITSTYNHNNSLEFVDEIDLPIGKIWFLSVFSCVKNVRGEVIGIQIMSVDISKQKQAEAEIKKSHERLEATNEKLQVVGSLTRHDVGNKLMAARSNLYLLRKKLKNDLELAKYLDGIENAFDQSNRIFEFSNLYEQIGSEEPYNMNVEDSFEEASKLIPHSGLEIINKAQGLTVLADGMLRQLFYNLIDNSLKHGKKVSEIQLSYFKRGIETKLIYEDNGNGISFENKQKIFSKGFTTGGSGLGLKLVKRMVEAYGWTITEEGEAGKGAKFVITIPK